jgi:hypothetical protein
VGRLEHLLKVRSGYTPLITSHITILNYHFTKVLHKSLFMSLCESCRSIPFRSLQRGEYPLGWKKDSWTNEHGQPWGCDSDVWTCNRRQTTLLQLKESATSCVLCRMLIHDLENRPAYIRLSKEVDLNVAPVWLLLPGYKSLYNQKLHLHLEQQTPGLESYLEMTAVEFRSRFGM